MDEIGNNGNSSVLSLRRGEELMNTLLQWLEKKEVAGATFTGIGAADDMELGYYNLGTKSFERHQITEEVEILSLNGNLGSLEGEKMLHVHGVFGRKDLSTFGGHIFTLRISGACELHLTPFPSPLHRRFDEETGLNILSVNT